MACTLMLGVYLLRGSVWLMSSKCISLVGCLDLKLLPEARIQKHRPSVDLFVAALDEPPVHIEGGSEALQFRAVAVSQQLPARLLQKPLDRVVALVIAHRQRLLNEASGVFRGLRIHDVRPCRSERMVDARAFGIRSDVQLTVGKPSVPVQVGQQVGASRLLAESLENGPFVGLSGGLHVDRVVAVVGLEPVSRMPAAGQGAGQDRHLPKQLPTVFGQGARGRSLRSCESLPGRDPWSDRRAPKSFPSRSDPSAGPRSRRRCGPGPRGRTCRSSSTPPP